MLTSFDLVIKEATPHYRYRCDLCLRQVYHTTGNMARKKSGKLAKCSSIMLTYKGRETVLFLLHFWQRNLFFATVRTRFTADWKTRKKGNCERIRGYSVRLFCTTGSCGIFLVDLALPDGISAILGWWRSRRNLVCFVVAASAGKSRSVRRKKDVGGLV